MVKRVKLGLSFLHYKNSGVINYLYSIIKALDTLPDEQKPLIVAFYYDKAAIEGIDDKLYPYLRFEPTSFEMGPQSPFKQWINSWSLKWFNTYWLKEYVSPEKADCIYPMFPYEAQFNRIRKKIHWMVDFNYRHMRQNYSETEYAYFTRIESEIMESGNEVVVSSNQVLEDLRHFYPHHRNNVHVLKFTAVLPSFEEIDIEEVRQKFGIRGAYFISPNQFWPHKNHIVLLKAAKLLQARGHQFQIVFTGNTKPGTSDDYFLFLKSFVEEHRLQKVISFLGSVDRKEQLQLIKNALSIVQPSLFEGWSTLIEEGKALQQFMVVSDLPIHREQIDYNCAFFDPADEQALAGQLERILIAGADKEMRDYSVNIRAFAHQIQQMIGGSKN